MLVRSQNAAIIAVLIMFVCQHIFIFLFGQVMAAPAPNGWKSNFKGKSSTSTIQPCPSNANLYWYINQFFVCHAADCNTICNRCDEVWCTFYMNNGQRCWWFGEERGCEEGPKSFRIEVNRMNKPWMRPWWEREPLYESSSSGEKNNNDNGTNNNKCCTVMWWYRWGGGWHI